MTPIDSVIFRELPVIQKIICDETWLEGERRGCWVDPEDPVVRERVCEVVLRVGRSLRASILEDLRACGEGPAPDSERAA
jgi:hypothetical protein